MSGATSRGFAVARIPPAAGPSRLRSSGHEMAFRLPPLREIPSVWAALRWLLGHCVGTPHGNLLIKARLRGLLMADGSNNWKADGPLATRLTREALKRLPRDPAELGRILHGLGEINARTNADLITPVIRHLRKQRPRIPFLKVFDAAAACEAKASGPPQLNAIDLAQWVSGSLLTWATFDRAVYRIGHLDIINPGRFGLGFAAKVITALDVGAIDTWIRHHPNRLRVATIAGAMLPSVSDADIMERATRLLRSRVPALKCLGAAFYVCPIFPRSPLDDFHESRRGLVANGVDPGDATWMMAYRIKNAVHSRYWTQHQLEQARARLRYLESKPEAAIGGRHNFEAEVRSLHTQIDRSSDRLTELGAALESMLEDLAAGWPADGLTEDQMHALENNFVQTPEIRVRVAGKLPQGANRTSLLKRDIDQLRNFIGLSKNPAEVLDTDFNPNDNRFEVILPWAAQSLILLYDDERRGVGKRTSDLVADLSKAFEALAAEPFAAQRKSGRWHSAYGRTASAYIFALLVVASMPEARRSEVATLNGLALDHVFQLLCIPYPDGRTS